MYAVLAGVITVSWRWPEIHDAVMPTMLESNLLYPIGKDDLSPVRLLLLALAYVTAKLLPDTRLDATLAGPAMLAHGNSLEVFCLGVLLAPLAGMVNALTDDAFAMQNFHRTGGGRVDGVVGGLAGVQ